MKYYLNFSNNKGFSLVELFLVTSIISAISAISVATYKEVKRNSIETKVKAELSNLIKASESSGLERFELTETPGMIVPQFVSIFKVGGSLSASGFNGQSQDAADNYLAGINLVLPNYLDQLPETTTAFAQYVVRATSDLGPTSSSIIKMSDACINDTLNRINCCSINWTYHPAGAINDMWCDQY